MGDMSLMCGCGHKVPLRANATKEERDEAFIKLGMLHGKTREEAKAELDRVNETMDELKALKLKNPGKKSMEAIRKVLSRKKKVK